MRTQGRRPRPCGQVSGRDYESAIIFLAAQWSGNGERLPLPRASPGIIINCLLITH
jgi:hypothetical protein